MGDRTTRDIPGLVSCGIFALLLVGSGALAVWGHLSGPGGHPSNDMIAFLTIVLAGTFVAPVGAILGFAGLAMRYRQTGTLLAVPSLVGAAANSIVFAAAAYIYFVHS